MQILSKKDQAVLESIASSAAQNEKISLGANGNKRTNPTMSRHPNVLSVRSRTMRSPRGAPRNVGPLSRKRLDAPTQSQDAGTTRQRVVAILRRKRTTQQEQKSATILPPMSSTRFASVPLYPIDPPKIHGTEITEDVDS